MVFDSGLKITQWSEYSGYLDMSTSDDQHHQSNGDDDDDLHQLNQGTQFLSRTELLPRNKNEMIHAASKQ